MEVTLITRIDDDSCMVTYNEKRIFTKAQLNKKREQLDLSKDQVDQMIAIIDEVP